MANTAGMTMRSVFFDAESDRDSEPSRTRNGRAVENPSSVSATASEAAYRWACHPSKLKAFSRKRTDSAHSEPKMRSPKRLHLTARGRGDFAAPIRIRFKMETRITATRMCESTLQKVR